VPDSLDQTVNVRLGGEVLLDARSTTDLDPSDTLGVSSDVSKLHFYWCLLSYPADASGTNISNTATDSVDSWLRVPFNVRAVACDGCEPRCCSSLFPCRWPLPSRVLLLSSDIVCWRVHFECAPWCADAQRRL
jgi:hypothetical protein